MCELDIFIFIDIYFRTDKIYDGKFLAGLEIIKYVEENLIKVEHEWYCYF